MAATLGAFMPAGAWAQEAGPALELPTVEVDAVRGSPANTLNTQSGASRLPGRVQDIPQTVTVVPRQVLEQQNATTLEEALRNVPGVTLSAGEGNGGLNGDQFRIRGFQAKNDVYLDGLRDFGVYVRDSFNIENVVALKGPSSEVFGAGTTGGAINVVSKRSFLGNQVVADGILGSGPLGRATVDVNRRIDETTAIRLNGMVHRQDVADRDNVFSDRWGFAGSLGLGLGTPVSWHLNYFHQTTDRIPDYGVPTIQIPGTRRALPATEFGLRRSTSFVRATDRDEGGVDLLTSLLSIKAADWLTINNDTRLTFFDRRFSTTSATCTGACVTGFLRGANPVVTYSAGGGSSFWQDAWGVQNVTTAVAKFSTWGLRHELVAGVDLFHQAEERTSGLVVGTRPNQQLLTPVFANATGYRIVPNAANRREGEVTSVGVFASDRVWLTDQLSVLGGLRWDEFDSRARTTVTAGPGAGTFNPWQSAETSFVSPRASVIWEPARDQSFYASYARSFTPPGLYVTNATGIELPTNGSAAYEPERNDLYEVGAKLSFLEGRLGLAGSVFRVVKGNSLDVDPVSGAFVVGPLDGGETRRVHGFEVSATGKITDAWSVQLAYAHLDGRVLTAQAPANIGNRAPYVPENSASLWTTYDAAPLLGLPGKLLVGGGVFWDDGYFPASDNVTFIPGTFQVDALVSYEHGNLRVALNGYNLTDEINYGSSFTSRAVPSSGRTVTLSAGVRF